MSAAVDLPTALTTAALAFAMYMAALKTRRLAFAMITVQIFVLAALAQALAWSQFKTLLSPGVMTGTIVAAALAGRLVKHYKESAGADLKNRVLLSLKEKELKEAHLQLIKQDESDRRILASDLHDQVLNDLKNLKTTLKKLESVEQNDAALLGEINGLIDQTTAQVREVMENLTPSVLENLGLSAAIDDLLRRTAARAGFKARYKNESGEKLDAITKIEQLLIFRIVQESLSNIAKHAQAGKVEIFVKAGADRSLIIEIEDDGTGIGEDAVRGASRGLRYMRQRADLIGAKIAWLPGPKGKGCLVRVTLLAQESS